MKLKAEAEIVRCSRFCSPGIKNSCKSVLSRGSSYQADLNLSLGLT